MYLKFFGLDEKPFNMTPDPRFLYLSPRHRKTLAQLQYGTQERKGFIVLTGKAGTGKTTVIHALRRRLGDHTAVSHVFNSTLPFDGLLECVLGDLGIATPAESRAQRLMVLNTLLIERERRGQNTVLIVDEAQNLSPETLEAIRLLSNLETTTTRRLQILLVGQPALGATLNLPELQPLKERVWFRCQLSPLDLDETDQYIRNRLRIAGAHDLEVFDAAAIDQIAAGSGGIPRIINILADHCLMLAYAEQKRRIDQACVELAVEYLERGLPTNRPVRFLASASRSWRGFA
jgi:general secretion pathway protein A